MGRPPGWIPRPLGAPQNTPRPVCPISPPGPRCPRPHAAVRHGGGGVPFWRCLTYTGKIRGLAGIFSYLECRRKPPHFVPGAKASRENHVGARPRSCTGPRSFRLSFPTIPSGPKRRVWPQTAWELPLAPKEEIPPRTDTRNEKGLAATRRAWVLMIY